jgi:hypothetical protein
MFGFVLECMDVDRDVTGTLDLLSDLGFGDEAGYVQHRGALFRKFNVYILDASLMLRTHPSQWIVGTVRTRTARSSSGAAVAS